MKLTKFIVMGALVTQITACSTTEPTKLNLEELVGYSINHPAGEVEGSDFAKSLHKEYYELGKYEGLLGDNDDSIFFWQRANMIDDGTIPQPTKISMRNIKHTSELKKVVKF